MGGGGGGVGIHLRERERCVGRASQSFVGSQGEVEEGVEEWRASPLECGTRYHFPSLLHLRLPCRRGVEGWCGGMGGGSLEVTAPLPSPDIACVEVCVWRGSFFLCVCVILCDLNSVAFICVFIYGTEL